MMVRENRKPDTEETHYAGELSFCSCSLFRMNDSVCCRRSIELADSRWNVISDTGMK
jgi:hypothetical protein